jgi:hypothetical protein
MSEDTKDALRHFFKGVKMGDTEVKVSFPGNKETFVEAVLTGSRDTQTTTLKFPANWHEHELELHGEGKSYSAILWCKKCSYSRVLVDDNNGNYEWREVKGPTSN